MKACGDCKIGWQSNDAPRCRFPRCLHGWRVRNADHGAFLLAVCLGLRGGGSQCGALLACGFGFAGARVCGSSQAVLTQFLQSASSLWVAVLSGLVVNLRMAVYSAAMAPRVRHLSTPRRMLAAAFLVDNAFAFMQQRRQDKPQESNDHLLAYYAGLTCVLWPAWIVFCMIGSLAGSVIPASWQLDFAIPLAFIATLSTTVRTMPLFAAAVAGGVASVVLFSLPLKLGLIAACLLGLLAGLITERLMLLRKASV
jgi:predicted branched-subunit amino acid permease